MACGKKLVVAFDDQIREKSAGLLTG